jgi:hypothetical protein
VTDDPNVRPVPAAYRPDDAFAGLFRAFTGGEPSIGAMLTACMVELSAGDPLLVSTASDMALFPGNSAPPRVESFRLSTRGFIELTAVSHLPLALCYLARLCELGHEGDALETIPALAGHAARVRAANTEAMWRERVALRAFRGLEARIVAMVEHVLARTLDWLARAGGDASMLRFETLRTGYLEASAGPGHGSMNDAMFATFCLAYLDIAWRIGGWLRGAGIDWARAMVLVSGQSGRPTAGVSWSTNNICQLIASASDGGLAPERLYVAPHAPGFSAADLPDAQGLGALEREYRRLWCHTRASVEVARRAFPQAPACEAAHDVRPSDMPAIASVHDRAACVARLRRIMEDPRQLLSNCVADYVVQQLGAQGDRPEAVPIPGFTDVRYGPA